MGSSKEITLFTVRPPLWKSLYYSLGPVIKSVHVLSAKLSESIYCSVKSSSVSVTQSNLMSCIYNFRCCILLWWMFRVDIYTSSFVTVHFLAHPGSFFHIFKSKSHSGMIPLLVFRQGFKIIASIFHWTEGDVKKYVA